MTDDPTHGPQTVSPDIVNSPSAVTKDELSHAHPSPYLQQLADHSQCYVYVKDRSGRYVMANVAVAAALGLPVEHLRGLTDADLADRGRMSSAEAFRIRETDNQVRARRRPLITEEQITCEGRRRCFHSIKSPWDHPDSGQVLGISIDITGDRTSMEMPRHEQRYQAFFEACDDAILAEETDGRIMDCNAAASKLYGYSREELLGMRAGDLVPPSERDRLYSLGRLQQRTGSVFTQSIGLARDGTIFPIEVYSRLIPLNDEVLSMVQIRDISDRRRVEGQMRLAYKMEAIGRLAGGIAHEFNNLLTVINGYSEFLLSTMGCDEEAYDDMMQINQAGQRAAELTHQLLAFSRRQTLTHSRVDLNLLIREMDPLLRSTASETVRVAMHLAPTLGAIRADRSQIEQIIVHLAVNACDAMPNGGALTLATTNVTLMADDQISHLPPLPGEYVCLTVCDTGVGMSPEVCEHLFEPFFTTKEVGQGTGLGLAMIYGAVQDLGGAIDVYSQPGEGSTFRVFLPRVQENDAEIPLDHDHLPRGQETLLLAQAQDDGRNHLARMLTRLGYTVIEAGNTADALQVVGYRGVAVDMVIAAETVPDEDADGGGASPIQGADLVAQIRTLYPQLPAMIICPAQREEQEDDSGLPRLTQPLTIDSVARQVHRTLHRIDQSPARRFYGHHWMDPLPNM